MDEMLATGSMGYDPEDTVVRAVQAALRSASDEREGGAAYLPIGVGLPPAAAGAEAAKVWWDTRRRRRRCCCCCCSCCKG